MQKKILVTGSPGLIGSEVCVYFSVQGDAPHDVDKNQAAVFFAPQAGSLWNQKLLDKDLRRFPHHERDIPDREGSRLVT